VTSQIILRRKPKSPARGTVRMPVTTASLVNCVLDTVSSRTRPARTRDDDAIATALHAAENEGWNPRLEPARRDRKWSLPRAAPESTIR
jgi:hypothetical protein